ncbi:hypothetical protein HK101_011841 [Irineochytrium annulatum]|nr:hypothetical protein HK101_011841 [Irineochytrium annulatum]
MEGVDEMNGTRSLLESVLEALTPLGRLDARIRASLATANNSKLDISHAREREAEPHGARSRGMTVEKVLRAEAERWKAEAHARDKMLEDVEARLENEKDKVKKLDVSLEGEKGRSRKLEGRIKELEMLVGIMEEKGEEMAKALRGAVTEKGTQCASV